MEPTHGDYDITDVEGYPELLEKIKAIYNAPTREARIAILSDLFLKGHSGSDGYIRFGNNKISNSVGIFNMNSATDCPNAASDPDNPTDTGVCQVPWNSCYAHKAEDMYPNSLPKRRRQAFLWNCIDIDTFSGALLHLKDRKTGPFDALRFNESGDVRGRDDVVRLEGIARRVSPEIDVYTYSASHRVDWSYAETVTVNQSNDLANYGDRSYSVVESRDDVPDDATLCPFSLAKKNGVPNDKRPKCGDCRLCIDTDAGNVYETLN